MKRIKILLLAVVASLMFAGCGNNPKTPSEVVLKVMEAAKDLDFKTAKKYATQKTQKRIEDMEKRMTEYINSANGVKNGLQGTTFKVLSENIAEDGNSATVEIEITDGDGETESKKLDLVKVDGEWKLDENLF